MTNDERELEDEPMCPKLDSMFADPGGLSIHLYRCRDGGWRVRVDTMGDRLYMRAYPALVQMAGHVLKEWAGGRSAGRVVASKKGTA